MNFSILHFILSFLFKYFICFKHVLCENYDIYIYFVMSCFVLIVYLSLLDFIIMFKPNSGTSVHTCMGIIRHSFELAGPVTVIECAYIPGSHMFRYGIHVKWNLDWSIKLYVFTVLMFTSLYKTKPLVYSPMAWQNYFT